MFQSSYRGRRRRITGRSLGVFRAIIIVMWFIFCSSAVCELKMLVWFAAYPHNSRRLNVYISGTSKYKARLSLPPVGWFAERLALHGIAQPSTHGHPRQFIEVLGILELSFETSWFGPLTRLSPEEALFHSYYHYADDLYTLRIVRVHMLQVPRLFRDIRAEPVNLRSVAGLGDSAGDWLLQGGGSVRQLCADLDGELGSNRAHWNPASPLRGR
ncbi:unnamed protein product [Prorocentrum cordatum]|uniref:Uncharacterized protein n=1 Tax=Prorocentrum cordatum TaxID=2364126 RepID=A0ABN9R5L7_9DINO|nr:unnamed protein product [Polarella glacialis]